MQLQGCKLQDLYCHYCGHGYYQNFKFQGDIRYIANMPFSLKWSLMLKGLFDGQLFHQNAGIVVQIHSLDSGYRPVSNNQEEIAVG